MRRLFNLAWLALMLGMALSYPLLPERVGDPGKEASRAVYAAVMMFVALNALLCSHHFILWMGRRAPDLINLPYKEYWFALERFEASLQRLATQLSALGLQVIGVNAVLYALPIAEQRGYPLPAPWGWGLVALFTVAFMAWVWRQFRLFPAPPAQEAHPPPRRPTPPRRPDKSRAHGQP